MVHVQPWFALVGYGLASACSLCWCIKDAAAALVQGGADFLAPDLVTKAVGGAEFDELQHTAQMIGTHILHSELCFFVLINFITSVYLLSALVTKALFLGSLTVSEASKMTERVLKFVVLKIVFLGAVVVPDKLEVMTWIGWFSVVGFLKVFVGLCRDRFESLMSSPSASVAAHVRTFCLLSMLLITDVCWIFMFMSASMELPLSYLLLWLFDVAVILVEGIQALVKYGVHMYDQMRGAEAERQGRPSSEGWEAKGAVLYHVELVTDLLLYSMTLAHYSHIFWMHGFALQLLDAILFLDLRSLIVALFTRIRGYQRYRTATHNLNHLFPDASPAQLMQRCDECAICKDHMQVAKVLPCEHLFHLSCLRAWLQQSGSDNFTCPICRASLFGAKESQPAAAGQAAQARLPPDWTVHPTRHAGAAQRFVDELFGGRWLPGLMRTSSGGLDAELAVFFDEDAEALSQAGRMSSSSSTQAQQHVCRFGERRSASGARDRHEGRDGEEVTSRPSSSTTPGLRQRCCSQIPGKHGGHPHAPSKAAMAARAEAPSPPQSVGRPAGRRTTGAVPSELARQIAAIQEVLPAAADHIVAAELARAGGNADEALMRVMAAT
ncbi:hypothetical protein WJX72_008208 [[Myrmecia] bisecta]|uniref:RING-type domain-containing protein n=1 Tax=[Myrmecia] bisecta TaxID=41462 RepID=A0AAW1P665_9CHLO